MFFVYGSLGGEDIEQDMWVQREVCRELLLIFIYHSRKEATALFEFCPSVYQPVGE